MLGVRPHRGREDLKVLGQDKRCSVCEVVKQPAVHENEPVQDRAVVRTQAREWHEILGWRAGHGDGVDLDDPDRAGNLHQAFSRGRRPRAGQALGTDGDASSVLSRQVH